MKQSFKISSGIPYCTEYYWILLILKIGFRKGMALQKFGISIFIGEQGGGIKGVR